MFRDRVLVIATKHSKEKIMTPILENQLGVKCIIPDEFDTDLLGTFSGEIERTLSPLHAARKKCEISMELTGSDLVVASDGSFWLSSVCSVSAGQSGVSDAD
jgi:hypothetical protein